MPVWIDRSATVRSSRAAGACTSGSILTAMARPTSCKARSTYSANRGTRTHGHRTAGHRTVGRCSSPRTMVGPATRGVRTPGAGCAGARTRGVRTRGARSNGAEVMTLSRRVKLLIAGASLLGFACVAIRIPEIRTWDESNLVAVAAVAILTIVAERFSIPLRRGSETVNFALTDGIWAAALIL